MLTPEALESQLKILFHSKALDLHTCEMKYYWRYHMYLVPKTKNPNFERGGYVHDVIHRAWKMGRDTQQALSKEAALAIALVEAEANFTMESDVQAQAARMALALWDELKSLEIVESEIKLSIPLPGGYSWQAKLDSIIKYPDGLWQGEYKTTKQYASNIKRLYHSSIQPFLYLYIADEHNFELNGTKMFVATDKLCIPEEVIATKQQMVEAEKFILETLYKVRKVEETSHYCKNRTQCVTLLNECPYRPLCVANPRSGYIEDTIKMLYTEVDPLAHYEET